MLVRVAAPNESPTLTDMERYLYNLEEDNHELMEMYERMVEEYDALLYDVVSVEEQIDEADAREERYTEFRKEVKDLVEDAKEKQRTITTPNGKKTKIGMKRG